MLLILVKLIGVYIAIMGVIFLLKPKMLKGYEAFWEEGKRLYIIGGSRILMGAILLLAAAQCRLKGVVVALGISLIIAGLPYFVLRVEKIKAMANRWAKRPPLVIRLLGLAILVIGALLLYSV